MPGFFTRKAIDVTFTRGSGKFAESGKDTVKLSGLRVSANVTRAGGTYQGALEMRIWGLTLSKMNDLATLGFRIAPAAAYLNNTVLVEAGEAGKGMSAVFFGTIDAAWADFAGMPDTPFVVHAYVGLWEALKPISPTSYRGLVDVATILSGICNVAGIHFVNSGVTEKLENVYYPGTAREQIERVCEHAHIDWSLDGGPPLILEIWPKGKSRGGQIPLISAETGMIGYPTFTAYGIACTTIFNPSLGMGRQVKVQSDLTPASRTWNVLTLAHELEAEVPGGSWLSRFGGVDPAITTPPVVR
jgi:hypothetical protein